MINRTNEFEISRLNSLKKGRFARTAREQNRKRGERIGGKKNKWTTFECPDHFSLEKGKESEENKRNRIEIQVEY